MNVVPFIPAHLDNLIVHEYMGHIQKEFSDDYGALLAEYPAYAGIVDGEVVACAGIVQVGADRWQAWALMSKDSGKYMVAITRAINDFVRNLSTARIETHVRKDFEAGHRWAKMLGFKNETPNGMRKWGDDGYDYCLYARVK